MTTKAQMRNGKTITDLVDVDGVLYYGWLKLIDVDGVEMFASGFKRQNPNGGADVSEPITIRQFEADRVSPAFAFELATLALRDILRQPESVVVIVPDVEAVAEEAHNEDEYAKAFVSIEGFEPEDDTVFEALVLMEEDGHAEQWNGFAVPYLNRAAVEALIELSDVADGADGCSVVKWDDDEHVVLSIDNGFEDEDGESAVLLTPDQIDGVDYWRMDIGWCWCFEALVHPTELMPTVGDFRALVENDGSVYAFEFVGGKVCGRLEFAAPYVWFEWMNLASVATNFDLSDYSLTTDEATRDAWNGSEAKDFTVMLLQRFNRYGGRFTYITDGMIGSKVK